MPIQYSSEIRDAVRVVEVRGSWTGGLDDDPLRKNFAEWIAAGDRGFVIDLAGLDLLNSIGLGKLVSYYTTLTREGGVIALSGMSERHRRAAYIARILDLFEEFDNVEAATESVAGRLDA